MSVILQAAQAIEKATFAKSVEGANAAIEMLSELEHHIVGAPRLELRRAKAWALATAGKHADAVELTLTDAMRLRGPGRAEAVDQLALLVAIVPADALALRAARALRYNVPREPRYVLLGNLVRRFGVAAADCLPAWERTAAEFLIEEDTEVFGEDRASLSLFFERWEQREERRRREAERRSKQLVAELSEGQLRWLQSEAERLSELE